MARKKKVKGEVPDYNNQLKGVLIVIGAVIIVGLFTYWIISEMKNVEYDGIKFQKITEGNIPFYYAKILIPQYPDNSPLAYNLYLRNDPRNSDVIVNATVKMLPTAFVSIDPEAQSGCSDNILASANLANFMKAFQVYYTTGYTDRAYANERNASYLDCSDALTQTGIIIKKSDKDMITQEGRCYTLEFKECDILKVVEKFIVEGIANSKQ